MQDVKDAWRQLTHRRGTSLTIVLTLALGIGANALVFSAVRAVLLAPLPFPEPDRLVNLWETQPANSTRGVAPANFLDWRSAASFEGIAAYNRKRRSIAGDSPERIQIATVSSNFFDVLGVRAVVGRTFSAIAPAGAPREVILRDDFWQRRFAADRSLIGKAIRLDDETVLVAGVVPRALAFPEDAVAWTQAPHDIPELGPGAPGDLRTVRDAWYFRVVGRLKPGVTIAQAQAEMDGVAARLQRAYPSSNREAGVRLVGLQEQLTESSAPTLWILLGVVGCVLAIACANVATLMLAAGSTRVRELSIRAALGASRPRLLRQLSAESLMVALVGGSLGLAVAMLGQPALVSLLPAGTPRIESIRVDWTVMLFTLGLSLAAAVAAGIAPAVMVSGSSFTTLRDGGRSGQSRRGTRMTAFLVGAQLAAALVLVTGTGLMLRTLYTLYQRDAGIDVERLLVLDVTLPDARSRGRAAAAVDISRIVERLAVMPGATSAAAIQSRPLSGGGAAATLRVAGRSFERNEAPDVQWRAITPGYFETAGARLLRGRGFTDADRDGSQAVTIINETLAQRVWPGADPIGARIGTGLDGDGAGVTIVGIVADIPQESLRTAAGPEMYRPLAQPSRFSTEAMSLVVRTNGEPAALASAAREAVRQVHPQAPVSAVRTMSAVAASGLATETTAARALAIFGGLALVLAAVGLYGVMSRLVSNRSRELGVRIALGAAPGAVRRLVLARTLRIASGGVVAGAAASVLLSQQLGSGLHGLGTLDPVVFATAATVLVIAALAASYAPALRASRIDPITVMKSE
jgi:predicted permease